MLSDLDQRKRDTEEVLEQAETEEVADDRRGRRTEGVSENSNRDIGEIF